MFGRVGESKGGMGASKDWNVPVVWSSSADMIELIVNLMGFDTIGVRLLKVEETWNQVSSLESQTVYTTSPGSGSPDPGSLNN